MAYPPPQGWGQPGQQQWNQQPQYPPQPQNQQQQQPYPPQQQPYGYPPQGAPQGAPYGQPAYAQGYPPAQPAHSPLGQYPPQQQYGYPPQAHPQQPPAPYGQHAHPQAPPQAYPQQSYPQQGYQQGYQHPPPAPLGPSAPPGQYTSTPPAQAVYGAAPMAQVTLPSLGYDPNVPCYTDMTYAAQQLRDAMAGVGTDENKLIEVLSQVHDPPHMLRLRHTYDDRFKRSLLRDLQEETSGYFRTAVIALCRGPLLEDAHLVNSAISGLGTKESMLDDVVLGRSNADLNAIKQCFGQVFNRDMTREISEDLSLKTANLFRFVLSASRAEEAAPVLPHDVDSNVERLHAATEGHRGFGSNQDEACKLIASSSNGMIRAIDQKYKTKYRKSLDELFKHQFSGHMRDSLRLMAARAVDPVKSDADELEATMHGLGTRDDLLVARLVRSHWNKEHFRQVKIAYQHFHGRNLSDRVSGETSGDYRKLLLALCG